MKPQLGKDTLIARALIVLAFLAAGGAGCSKQTASNATSASTAVQTTTTTPSTTTSPVVCSATVTATILATNMSNAQVNANADVVWQVTASGGCPSYNLVRKDGTPKVSFSGTISYTTRYTQIGSGIREYVDIEGVTSTGTVQQTVSIQSAQFSVLPGGTTTTSGAISCSAVANPTLINVRVDSAGTVIDTAVPIYLTVLLNKPGKITNIVNSGATFSIAAGVPSQYDALTQQASATNFRPGLNTMTITVTDPSPPTGAAATATCLAAVQVNSVLVTGTPLPTPPVGPLPPAPAPTCTLIASQTSAKPGDQITLSLNGAGSVTNGDIEGRAVSPAGGQATTFATVTKTFVGHVYGPGGIGSCSVTVTTNPVEVGVNFEDYTDGDFNDSVVCTTGAFSVLGKQVFSVMPQSAVVKTYKNSACDHQVELQIIDEYGRIVEKYDYNSSQRPTFNVFFGPSWQINVLFHSLGSCANNQGWIGQNSSKVQVGYYCRKTGN